MIRVICPSCRAKLNAKEELIGQTRDCPRCGGPVVIKPADESESSVEIRDSANNEVASSADIPSTIAHVDVPLRLERSNWYVICDPSRIIAAWENNGQGWRIRTDRGFASAARYPERIPTQGDFKLVELRMAVSGDEVRLKAVRVYQLVARWALTGLARGDDVVCKSIVGPGPLMRAQKNAVRMQLQERFMHDVWGDAAEVLDYLSNGDYHSSGAGP